MKKLLAIMMMAAVLSLGSVSIAAAQDTGSSTVTTTESSNDEGDTGMWGLAGLLGLLGLLGLKRRDDDRVVTRSRVDTDRNR
jgi:MYXO-CTERM domain-containing protein